MARKKSSKVSIKSKATGKELLSSPSSYRSLLFGIITVVVLFLIGVFVFQFLQNRPKGDINGNGLSTQDLNEALKNSGTYTVQPSDTLWGIAERELGSGFEWPKIADVNNIKTPEDLEEGVRLTIPSKAEVDSVPADSGFIKDEANTEEYELEKIETEEVIAKTYVIKRGDTLWSIAEDMFGDGNRWEDIAKANGLEKNPDLIHADNTLVIPQ